MNKSIFNIIYKDLYMSRKIWWLLFIPSLIHFLLFEALIVSYTGESLFYPYLTSSLYVLIIIACVQYLDSKHNIFIHSLKITRIEQITAKYLLVIIVGLINTILVGLIGGLLKLIGISIMSFISIMDLISTISVLMCITTLTLPVNFLLKANWGLIAHIWALITSILIIFFYPTIDDIAQANIFYMLIKEIKDFYTNYLNCFSFFMISLTLFFISYLFTTIFYIKKDF